MAGFWVLAVLYIIYRLKRYEKLKITSEQSLANLERIHGKFYA